MVYIGIDPDTKKNGVALWDKLTKKLELKSLSFFELYDELSILNAITPVKVKLEAGWLNRKSNWHDEKSGYGIASRIGAKTGANHETGKKIEEMLQYLNIPYDLVVPKSSKVDHKYFSKVTGYKGKTNQETRDSGMLVYGL